MISVYIIGFSYNFLNVISLRNDISKLELQRGEKLDKEFAKMTYEEIGYVSSHTQRRVDMSTAFYL